ncbi:MAG: AAA family ATPase [Elusimicrobiota bacterium]
MKKARIKLWFSENWLKLFLWTIGILCAIATVYGTYVFLFQLESFQKQSLVASFPIYLINGIVTSMVFIYGYTLMGGRMGQLKKNKKMDAELLKIKFSDVIGLEEAKREALEVVKLVKDRALVKKIGGKIIRGILLQGPPGCGKTLLAKAMASECGLPFMAISGSEFVEIFVGVGASRVRQLVTKARVMAEIHGGCIIFIDELDVIGRARTFNAFGGSEETNSTQNELLVQMDGIQSTNDQIIFIGATNASENTLDPALLRPGRFDRKLYVGKPHLKEREDLFKYYLGKINADPALDIRKLAQRSVYKSPAEIEAAIKESALIAAREGREVVLFKDLSSAFERIDLGIAHRLPMTDKEKQVIATHEAGHLVTVYTAHPGKDVFKATILNRGGALGHVMPISREEEYTRTKTDLVADIKVALAGFISERIKFGVTSTGASSDFANALGIAEAMVWEYGMGTSGVIGNYGIHRNGGSIMQLSEEFKSKLNSEVQSLLRQCEKETEDFLKSEWQMVEIFAKLLIEKEELNYDEIEEVFVQNGKSRLPSPNN